ncbi:CD63 antigen [Copidosoma floridanum]|uniref:CD63 antigen n=1 Tax=Copidosoma floridanum TaxID=29053 RepID=UPI0006C9B597|nr:CD63 antigen [Copidosoma floridanum]
MTFSIILSTVFILEFITLVTAYTLQDDVNYYLSKKMEDTMKQYYKNPAAQNTIDNLQQNLKCCGYDGPDQLMKIVAYKSVILIEVYPSSCFECENSKCQAQLFTQGCHQTLADIVNDNTVSLITGVTIIIFVQVVSIMLACTLERMIHKHKMDRNMRMCQKRTTRQNIYVPFDKTNPTTTFHAVHI